MDFGEDSLTQSSKVSQNISQHSDKHNLVNTATSKTTTTTIVCGFVKAWHWWRLLVRRLTSLVYFVRVEFFVVVSTSGLFAVNPRLVLFVRQTNSVQLEHGPSGGGSP